MYMKKSILSTFLLSLSLPSMAAINLPANEMHYLNCFDDKLFRPVSNAPENYIVDYFEVLKSPQFKSNFKDITPKQYDYGEDYGGDAPSVSVYQPKSDLNLMGFSIRQVFLESFTWHMQGMTVRLTTPTSYNAVKTSLEKRYGTFKSFKIAPYSESEFGIIKRYPQKQEDFKYDLIHTLTISKAASGKGTEISCAIFGDPDAL